MFSRWNSRRPSRLSAYLLRPFAWRCPPASTTPDHTGTQGYVGDERERERRPVLVAGVPDVRTLSADEYADAFYKATKRRYHPNTKGVACGPRGVVRKAITSHSGTAVDTATKSRGYGADTSSIKVPIDRAETERNDARHRTTRG